MRNSFDKGILYKIYTVIGLCLVITFLLLFMIITGVGTRSGKHGVTANSSSASDLGLDSSLVESSSPITDVTPIPAVSSEDEPALEPTMEPEPTEEPLTEPEPTEEPVSEPEPTDQPEHSHADVYSDSSLLRIVNKDHVIDPNYVPENLVVPSVSQQNTQKLRVEAAAAIEQMFQGAANDGVKLYLVSGYRSYQEQQNLYREYVSRYGSERANMIDSYPGTSEHQIGLSVDLGAADRGCELRNCFKGTAAYAWLQAHSYEYGYIERNPMNSESWTGIQYSPWNFRYVGVEEAKKLYESGMSMEEFYYPQG